MCERRRSRVLHLLEIQVVNDIQPSAGIAPGDELVKKSAWLLRLICGGLEERFHTHNDGLTWCFSNIPSQWAQNDMKDIITGARTRAWCKNYTSSASTYPGGQHNLGFYTKCVLQLPMQGGLLIAKMCTFPTVEFLLIPWFEIAKIA